LSLVFSCCFAHSRALRSFPTRRSSDLILPPAFNLTTMAFISSLTSGRAFSMASGTVWSSRLLRAVNSSTDFFSRWLWFDGCSVIFIAGNLFFVSLSGSNLPGMFLDLFYGLYNLVHILPFTQQHGLGKPNRLLSRQYIVLWTLVPFKPFPHGFLTIDFK